MLHDGGIGGTGAIQPILIDDKAAAKLLGISARSLWTLANRGEVRSVRVGRRRLYRPADLEAFVTARAEGVEV